ncbi:DUF2336 domain-containing protein [Chthonobacter albigriseus]|uniref:DUF2336 domain-containing protein n=1 Tax=Chthonobacter albigriseus TaxID=1683161 RepID=UPI0015EEC19C|nr:DUF2336 domain-containing protein [Chthonobacter albigriseus]
MLVFRFLAWLDTAPPHARAEAVAPLVQRFFMGEISPDEREALDAALTVMLDDPSADVRRALAEALALYEEAPRHLVVALAHDRSDVSEPLFRRSPCLLEAELLTGVRSGASRTQVAVARRPWVPYTVSALIAETASKDAVLALVRNDGSDIDEEAFHAMARRFGDDPAVREALFARTDLPINVRQSVIALLVTRFNARCDAVSSGGRRLQDTMRDACDRATIQLLMEADEEEIVSLVDHLRDTGQLTTALLIRAMCSGQIRFFEAALASLTGLPSTRVYSILVGGRESVLSSLLTKAKLPERSHKAFLIALEVWRETDFDGAPGEEKRFARRMIERILTRYQSFAPGEIDDLLALLRRLASEAAREAARAFVANARHALLRPHAEDIIVTEAPDHRESLPRSAQSATRQAVRIEPEPQADLGAAIYHATALTTATQHDFEADLAAALDSLDLELAIADAIDVYDLDKAYEDALRELAGDAPQVARRAA